MNYKTNVPIFAGILFCLVAITPNAYAVLLIDGFTDGPSFIASNTVKFVDGGAVGFDAGEALYEDVDSSGTRNAGDVRIANTISDGTTILGGDTDDDNTTLATFVNPVKFVDGGAVGFDAGEALYEDVDSSGTRNAGDIRIANTISDGTTILGGDADNNGQQLTTFENADCADSLLVAAVLGDKRHMFACSDSTVFSPSRIATAETDTTAQQFIFTLDVAKGSSGLNYDDGGNLLQLVDQDLTQGGANNVLVLDFIKADIQTKVTVEVADSNGDIGTFEFDFGPTASPETRYIPFMMIDDPLTMAIPDFTKIVHVGVFFEGNGLSAQNAELILGSISAAPIKISDFVWNDTDGDGIQDAGEPGIAGVIVNLLDSSGTNILSTTTTDANGEYEFGVSPGSYVVEFVLPAGFVFSSQDQGGDDAVDSDADANTGRTGVITVGFDEINPTVDAGLLEGATIGNFVWNDLNENGIQDPGEPGIEGITVNLLDSSLIQIQTMQTDSNGEFWFTGLQPGTYTVEFVPGIFSFSPQDQGGDDTVDSDADENTGRTGSITVASGETNDTVDAGLIQVPEILSLSLSPTSISENGGTSTGTISRTGPTTDALTVGLVSSDITEATLPASVIIPVGQPSTTFTITAVDDAIIDGTQTVTIGASAVGFANVNANLDVTDDETTPQVVGGKIIQIETTSLLLAGAQSFSWMIPVVLSVLGIGMFVVSRKSENS